MNQSSKWLKCVLFGLWIWCSACHSNQKVQDETNQEKMVTDSVATVEATSPTRNHIECMAIVDVPPAYVYEIHARIDGFLSNLNILEGQSVKKGELLANIESPEFARLQKAFLEAQSNYHWQVKNFERNKDLYKAGSISSREWQQTERDFNMAKAQWQGLGAELKSIGFDLEKLENETNFQLEIRSKISGTVTQIDVKNGSRVSPNTHLFTIIDKTHLHAEISIPAQYISKIERGTPFFTVINGDTIHGHIFLINYQANEQNMVKVHGHFDDEKMLDQIPVGQRMFVNIITDGLVKPLSGTEHH